MQHSRRLSLAFAPASGVALRLRLRRRYAATSLRPWACSATTRATLEIRRASRDDASALARVVNDAFRNELAPWAAPMGGLLQFVKRGDLAGQFAKRADADARRHALLIALDASEIVGCVEIGLLRVPAALVCANPADAWAERDQTLVGTDADEERPRTPYIGNLAVKRDARRRGVASTLVRAAEEAARGWGNDSVVLHVDARNESAAKLYRRMGYACSVREPEWYPAVGRVQRLFLVRELDEERGEPSEAEWDAAPVRHTRELDVGEYLRWCLYDLRRKR